MWNQHLNREIAKNGLVLACHWESGEDQLASMIGMPELYSLLDGGGFSIDMRFNLQDSTEPFAIIDTTGVNGAGILIE